jgi:choline dehydrogenase
MAYVRSNEADLDAWERLGNAGWNWASLYPYSMRAENFTIPGPGLQAAGVTFDAAVHGDSGPVRTGYGNAFLNLTLTPTVHDAWEELGLPPNVDTGRGNNRGVSANPLTLEPGSPDIRWDSARAYWYPVEDRPNLTIIRGTARRLVWEDSDTPSSEEATSATGVEYLDEDGQAVVLSATKEVILSAGSLRTPLVLESSGVGNPGWVKPRRARLGNT